jgi:signal transduction histidine kinase
MLATALEELAQNVADKFGVRCDLRFRTDVWPEDPTVNLHLYRIAQEAITNAVKHGHARTIQISFSVENGGGVLRIQDDGVGLLDMPEQTRGTGFALMQHRARAMGGYLALEPVPPHGTAVICTLPTMVVKPPASELPAKPR